MKKTINFMKMRRLFFMVSAALIIGSFLSMLVIKFNAGIDFTGGLTAQLNTHFTDMDVSRLRDLFSSVSVMRIYKNGKQEKVQVNLGKNINSLETDGSALPLVKGVTDKASSFLIRIKNLKGDGWTVKKEQLETALSDILRKEFPAQSRLVFQVAPAEAGADAAMLARLLQKQGKFSITETKPDALGAGLNTVFLVSQDLSSNYDKIRKAVVAAIQGDKDFTLDGPVTASGVQYTARIKGKRTTVADLTLRKLLVGIPVDRVLQEDAGDGMATYTIRGRVVDEAALTAAIEGVFEGQSSFRLLRNARTRDRVDFLYAFNWESFTAVSATIGKEVESAAIMLAFGVALIILLYIAIRFDYRFGLAAVSALFHDVLIMLGIISVLQIELSVPIVAAILTILGYSINDTIVIFDRIRENLAFSRKEDLPEVINRSISQSLSRTVITSLTTLLAVFSIYFFAGSVLRDFAGTLIIGVVVGTYSSIYIASPVYLFIEKQFGGRELKTKKTLKV